MTDSNNIPQELNADENVKNSMHVASSEGAPETFIVESKDPDWKELKRKFWEEYAKKYGLNVTHDINIEEDTYTCSLTKKDEKEDKEKPLGSINYTSEFNAQVSKDADLVMYQGLVQDAAANGLSITFGESLDDKQKALLLAATLIHGNESGKKIEVIGAPTIDLNAPYFKELPKEAQEVLKVEKERLDTLSRIKEKQGAQQEQKNNSVSQEVPEATKQTTPQTAPASILSQNQAER